MSDHVGAKIRCDKMDTEFYLELENDLIKWFIYINGFLIQLKNEFPCAREIARTSLLVCETRRRGDESVSGGA